MTKTFRCLYYHNDFVISRFDLPKKYCSEKCLGLESKKLPECSVMFIGVEVEDGLRVRRRFTTPFDIFLDESMHFAMKELRI